MKTDRVKLLQEEVLAVNRNAMMRGLGGSGRALLVAVLISWTSGCAILDQRSQAELEAAYGPNKPQLEASFAATQLSPGDTWRIYFKGSDKDRDIQFIHVWMQGPLRSTTPVRLMTSSEPDGSLRGYLTLDSSDLVGGDLFMLASVWVRLWVSLEDRAGHRSEYAVFPLSFYLGAIQAKPPPGAFEEKFLARIPAEQFPVERHGGGLPSFP